MTAELLTKTFSSRFSSALPLQAPPRISIPMQNIVELASPVAQISQEPSNPTAKQLPIVLASALMLVLAAGMTFTGTRWMQVTTTPLSVDAKVIKKLASLP
jgi:hypothetical protein